MSPTVHLLLVVNTLLFAGFALMVAGLTPATIVSCTAAIVGLLLYIRPIDLRVADARGGEASEPIGGCDAG